jgi:hypothetical protein
MRYGPRLYCFSIYAGLIALLNTFQESNIHLLKSKSADLRAGWYTEGNRWHSPLWVMKAKSWDLRVNLYCNVLPGHIACLIFIPGLAHHPINITTDLALNLIPRFLLHDEKWVLVLFPRARVPRWPNWSRKQVHQGRDVLTKSPLNAMNINLFQQALMLSCLKLFYQVVMGKL